MLEYNTHNYCKEPYTIPCKYNCLWSEILREYMNLVDRYKRSVTKNERFWRLSQPRECTTIYQDTNYRRTDKYPMVQLINKSDQMENTRTEMLAYPYPRKLVELKNHASYKCFHCKRKSRINRLLRKSLLSLYSHLAGVQPPYKPRCKQITNREQSEKRLKQLSMPRKDASKPAELSEKSTIKDPKKGTLVSIPTTNQPKYDRDRLSDLAKPRDLIMEEPFEWKFTSAMKNFMPSENLLKISKPRRRSTMHDEERKSLTLALKYKASKRIQQLAEPIRINKKELSDGSGGESPLDTMRRALNFKPNERTINLAKPRSYIDIHTRNNPFKVKQSALLYKATDRIKRLATPREIK